MRLARRKSNELTPGLPHGHLRACALAVVAATLLQPAGVRGEGKYCDSMCNGSTCSIIGVDADCKGECTQQPAPDDPECSCKATCTAKPPPEEEQAQCRGNPEPRTDRDPVCGNGLDSQCTSMPGADCNKPDCGLDTCPALCKKAARTQLAGHDPIQMKTRAALTEPFTDFEASGLVTLGITRTYSSADVSVRGGSTSLGIGSPFGGAFGKGWHHQWEAMVVCTSSRNCRVFQGLDETMMFRWSRRAPGVGALAGEQLELYVRSDSEALTSGDRSKLVRRPSGEFILYRPDGVELHFEPDCGHDYCSDGDGFCKDPWQGGRVHLSRMVDPRGNAVRVGYDRPAGVLLSLTDDLGHRLELRAAGNACPGSSTSKAQSLWYDGVRYVDYEYSGYQLITTRQAAPDRNGPIIRSYEYGKVGYLARIRNEAGDPIVEFGYDARGYATSVVDRLSNVTVTYPDSTSASATTIGGGMSGFASDASHSGGGGGGGSAYFDMGQEAYMSSIGRALRCMQDVGGRTHWLDRDVDSRVVHHALYARGVYDCRSSDAPASTLVPLFEEWFEYGLHKPIAEGFSVELTIKTALIRRSVLGSSLSADPRQTSHVAAQRFDHDQGTKPGDPTGYRCMPGENAALVVCRRVESGYTLDAGGSPVPEQHTTYFSYDSRGRLVKIIGPVTTLGATPPGTITPVEERSYWPDSGSASDLPRLGRLRDVRRYVSPSGSPLVTSYDYDVFGPYQIVDPGGRTTLLAKDGLGRVVGVAMPDGRAVSVRYYDGEWPHAVVLGTGATQRLRYDLRGRVSLVELLASDPEATVPTTPDGNPAVAVGWSEAREYDGEGNAILVQRRDGAGVVCWRQALQYDTEHQVRSGQHPEVPGRSWELTYDSAGTPTQFTDEEGRGVTLVLDELGRARVARRSGTTLSGAAATLDVGTYGYETESEQLASVIDGAGRATTYRHDDFGRVLSVESPETLKAGGARYQYDARGNVVTRLFGSTQVTYRYDGLDRLTFMAATSSVGAPGVSYAFEWDGRPGDLGRLTAVVGAGRTTSYEYDEAGRLRFERVTDDGPSSPLVTEYRYDAAGAIDTVVYPSGLAVRYERDPATGRPVAVRDATTGAAWASGVSFWPGGPLRGLTFGNGLTMSGAVNQRYEPLAIASGPVSLGYTPSLAGDIGAIASPQGDEVYGYDFADRLVSRAATTGIRSDPLAVAYAGGRMARLLHQPSGAPVHAFGYDEQSDVSAISAYDTAGASITSTVCLVHDALGRLVVAGYARPGNTDPDGLACRSEEDVQQVVARFRYDAANRRIARQGSSGEWTYFTFMGGEVLSETTASGTPVREYVWLESVPLAQVEHAGGAGSYYFHVDHLGMPRALTNAEGQVVWSARTLPYGEVLEEAVADPLTGRTVVTNLRLPGQYDERLLGPLGLQGPYYNWNRWYLPGVGRYLEPDPIALAGGFNGEFGVDWYGYADQNPLSYTDPTGEFAITIEAAVVVVIVLGVVVTVLMPKPRLGPAEPWNPSPGPDNPTIPWLQPRPAPKPGSGPGLGPDFYCDPDDDGYSCTAKCQANGGPTGAYYVTGTSTRNCREAVQAAKASTPRGQYPRHCSCSDTRGFRGTGTQCENHRLR